MTGTHQRNTGPMLASPRCGAKDQVRRFVQLAGGGGKEEVPNAWWRSWLGRAKRQSKCAEAWDLHEVRHSASSRDARFDAGSIVEAA